MKRQELFIIFVLAVTVAAVNFSNNWYGSWKVSGYTVWGGLNWWNFPLQIFAPLFSTLLLPRISCVETPSGVACPSIHIGPGFYLIVGVVDLLFWFLVLAIGYQLIKGVDKNFSRKWGDIKNV